MSDLKLKILCFHGYRQCGESFKQKTGSLRKILKKHAELHYLTAPHHVPVPIEHDGEDSGNAWWFSQENNTFKAVQKSNLAIGFKESLKFVEDFVKINGPFDGILGFSQGAAFAALLCQHQEMQLLQFTFKFAIFISGFISQSDHHQSLFSQRCIIPTLHIYGKNDQVIASQMSVDLLQHFEDPTFHEHDGGHFVPASNPSKTAYIHFLEKLEN